MLRSTRLNKHTSNVLRKSLSSYRLFTCAALLLFSILPRVQAQSAIASQPTLPPAVTQVVELQRQLEELKNNLITDVENAQKAKLANAPDLLQWQTLANQFVFKTEELSHLQERARLQQHIDETKNQYNKLIDDFYLIGKTVDAEKKAELTRKDSKMYYKMRVRSAIPQKTLKAYGVMELAKRSRDQGKFTEALALWDQAEIMVKESFNEHIAESAKWREDAVRNAQAQHAEIKSKVMAYLADYFITIPAGQFDMGSTEGGPDEMPVHTVKVSSFKLGKTEMTFDMWDWCLEDGSCFVVPEDEGWGRGDRPVINISYHDITKQFIPWLNKITGSEFRLPTEAEWEYAARAGTRTEFSWGDTAQCIQARYDGGTTSVCNAKQGKNRGPAPVKSFPANPFGLFDMHGNTWEWLEDCWNTSYQGAPSDGSAWISGNCDARVLRGGSWDYDASGMRSANRYSFIHNSRQSGFGFRLVQIN